MLIVTDMLVAICKVVVALMRKCEVMLRNVRFIGVDETRYVPIDTLIVMRVDPS